MKVKLEWTVNREDPRYNGDCDHKDFNDGVIKEEILEVKKAEEFKHLLLRYGKWNGVDILFGEFENYFYIEYNLERSNEKFEEDVKNEILVL